MSWGVKRCMDVTLASVALVVLGPAMLGIALAIRLNMGSPVLFRQLRPGLHARPFKLVKFRTMRDVRDRKGRLLPIDERVTRLGVLLRRLSLDELPELWNILRGDMSVVGPRPLLMEYLPVYTPEQARRHEVKPGLTGWAQVNGRHALDWEERFRLDAWYVDNWSPRLDLKIIGMTIQRVISGEGSGMGKEPPPHFKDRLNIGEHDPS
jgi:sugar transferase EpsL